MDSNSSYSLLVESIRLDSSNNFTLNLFVKCIMATAQVLSTTVVRVHINAYSIKFESFRKMCMRIPVSA
jgi:hypothetical protein